MSSPQNPNGRLGVKHVFIRSIDVASDTIYATDPNGAEIQLPLRIRRVGITPVVGQTWLVDTTLGFWSLAALVEPTSENTQVLITSIDTTGGIIYATDTVSGAEIQLPWLIRRVGITPAVGQTWLADTSLGFWSLAAFVETTGWTAPNGCYTDTQEQTAAVTQLLTTSDWFFPITNPTFTNPSPVWQMRVAARLHARMTVNLPAASGGDLKLFCQFANHSIGARNASTPVGNPTTGTVSALWVSAWNTDETVVDPGQTVTLTTTVSAFSYASSPAPTLTTWLLRAHFLAWLIDPTQPGGVS